MSLFIQSCRKVWGKVVRWPYWGALVGGCYTWDGPTQLRDFGGRGQGGLKVVSAEPRYVTGPLISGQTTAQQNQWNLSRHELRYRHGPIDSRTSAKRPVNCPHDCRRTQYHSGPMGPSQLGAAVSL